MRTQQTRLLMVALFATATVAWPGSSSAQLLDPCKSRATVTVPAPFGHEVTGSATYTCTAEHFRVSVMGCLLLDGVPVDCDAAEETDSSSASVNLSFPCVPGVWTTVAVGLSADRTLPAPDVDDAEVATECDPLGP